MPKFCRIENNRVAEIFEEQPVLHPSLMGSIRPVIDNQVKIGWLFDQQSGKVSPPTQAPRILSFRIEERCNEADDIFKRKLEDGLTYLGKVLQIREQDQINLTAMGNEARWALATSSPWPSDFAWRMKDDSFLPLPDAVSCIQLATEAKEEVLRLRRAKWRHVDALRNLATLAEVDAYDLTTGW